MGKLEDGLQDIGRRLRGVFRRGVQRSPPLAEENAPASQTPLLSLDPHLAAEKFGGFFQEPLEVTSWLHDLGLLKGSVANSLLMTHPLFCRFKNRKVEAAFAVFKANSSMGTLHLILTVVLGMLTMSSLFVAPMFNTVVDRRRISLKTQMKITIPTLLIYGRRIYQVMLRKPMTAIDVDAPLYRRLITNIWRLHYSPLLLILGLVAETCTDPRMSMSLYMLIVSVYLLVSSSLRVACSLLYIITAQCAYFLYNFHIVARRSEREVDSAGVPMLSTLACIMMGLLMAYYLVRTEEMVLRDQFKAQHLAGFLYQSALQEQRMADELIAAALPAVIARRVVPEPKVQPSSLSANNNINNKDRATTSVASDASSHAERRTSYDLSGLSVSSMLDSLHEAEGGPFAESVQGPWCYPSKSKVRHLTKRYRLRIPPPVHPCRTVRAFHSSSMIQRKFCTVLVAHFVKDAHLRAPRWVMETVLREMMLCAANQRVELVPTTGCTIRAICGIAESWGSARRDARAVISMASDLIAITETLGLELCIGINSGSVVAALDCLSPSLFDLLGNVVSNAQLLADMVLPGQIILDEASYQLMSRDQYEHPSGSRVITHHLKVRLLNGTKESFAAISNPFSLSWWFLNRRQEVLEELQQHKNQLDAASSIARHGEACFSIREARLSLRALAAKGKERPAPVPVDLEAGLGPVHQRSSHSEDNNCLFSQRTVHPLDVYARRHALHKLSSAPSLMPIEPHTINNFSDVASLLLAPFLSSFGPSSNPTHLLLQRCRERYALQPWWELNSILIITACSCNIWTFRPDAFSIVPLLLTYPLSVVLQLRPRSLVFFLFYAFVAALVVIALSIDRDVFPVAMLRMVLLMGPALFLPTLQSLCLAAEVFIFTRANRLIFWARTGGDQWVLERILVQTFWLLPLILVLIAVKCRAELCASTVYVDMYPCIRRLQRIRHALAARTDEIIKSVMPFPLPPEDARLVQPSETLATVLPASLVILHVEVDSLRNIDGLVLPIQLFALQRKILSVLDGAVRLASATPLFHSGQTYVAACGVWNGRRGDLASAIDCGSRGGEQGLRGRNTDPVLQALELATAIRNRIKEFNLKHRVSLSVKMGMARGPVLLSWCTTPHMDATGLPVRVAKALALQTRRTAITADLRAHITAASSRSSSPFVLRGVTFHPMEPVTVFGQDVECVEMKIDSEGADAVAGPKIEDFEVLGLLGSGGYGSVHLAREPQNGTLVAVKVMLKRPKGVSAPMRVELNVLAQVQHPHVVNFHYCLQSASKLYLVMEYIRGGTLKRILREQKPPLPVLRIWFAELVLALGYLHSMNVIHRDIKPENIMIGEDGHLKVTDFGLAKVIKAKGVARTGEIWEAACGGEMVHLMQRLMPISSRSNSNYSGASLCGNGTPQGSSSSSMPPSMVHLPHQVQAKQQRPPYNILVVEDEPFTRFVTRAVLKGMGFEPITVPDGKRALKRLHSSLHGQKPIDLILLDLDLPGMTGPQLLSELKADLHLRRIPVVVLSSEDRMEEITTCMDSGANEYFIKPLRPAMASSLIKFAKDRRREWVKMGGGNVGDPTVYEAEGDEDEDEKQEEGEERKTGAAPRGPVTAKTMSGRVGRPPIPFPRSSSAGSIKAALHAPHHDWGGYLEEAFPAQRSIKRRQSESGFLTPDREGRIGLGEGYRFDGFDDAEGGTGQRRTFAERSGVSGEQECWEGDEDEEYELDLHDEDRGTYGPEATRQTADTWVSQDRFSQVGTPYYMSPEMIDRQPYGPPVDYWALGVLIFEAMTGFLPFTGDSPRAVFAAIRAVNAPWTKLRKCRDPLLESLVMDLLNPNQAERLDYSQAKRHPYFSDLRWESLSTTDTGLKPVVQLPKPSSSRRKFGRSSNEHGSAATVKDPKTATPNDRPISLADVDMRNRSKQNQRRNVAWGGTRSGMRRKNDGGDETAAAAPAASLKPESPRHPFPPREAPRYTEAASPTAGVSVGKGNGDQQLTHSTAAPETDRRQPRSHAQNSHHLGERAGGGCGGGCKAKAQHQSNTLSSLSITLSSRRSSSRRRNRSSSHFYYQGSSTWQSDTSFRDDCDHSMSKPAFNRKKWLALLHAGPGSRKERKEEEEELGSCRYSEEKPLSISAVGAMEAGRIPSESGSISNSGTNHKDDEAQSWQAAEETGQYQLDWRQQWEKVERTLKKEALASD